MARSSRVKSGLGAGVAGPAAEFHQVRLQQSPAPGKFRAGTSVRVRAAAPRAGKLRPGAVAPAGGGGREGVRGGAGHRKRKAAAAAAAAATTVAAGEGGRKQHGGGGSGRCRQRHGTAVGGR